MTTNISEGGPPDTGPGKAQDHPEPRVANEELVKDVAHVREWFPFPGMVVLPKCS